MQSNLFNVDIKGSRATYWFDYSTIQSTYSVFFNVLFLTVYFLLFTTEQCSMLVCNKEVISSKCQVILSNVCDMPCFYSFSAGWWSRKQFIKGLFPGRRNIKYIFFNQHYYILGWRNYVGTRLVYNLILGRRILPTLDCSQPNVLLVTVFLVGKLDSCINGETEEGGLYTL